MQSLQCLMKLGQIEPLNNSKTQSGLVLLTNSASREPTERRPATQANFMLSCAFQLFIFGRGVVFGWWGRGRGYITVYMEG